MEVLVVDQCWTESDTRFQALGANERLIGPEVLEWLERVRAHVLDV